MTGLPLRRSTRPHRTSRITSSEVRLPLRRRRAGHSRESVRSICCHAQRAMKPCPPATSAAPATGRRSGPLRGGSRRICRAAASSLAWRLQSQRPACPLAPSDSRYRHGRGRPPCSPTLGCSTAGRMRCGKASGSAGRGRPDQGGGRRRLPGAGRRAGDRLRRPGPHAWPDRRALALACWPPCHWRLLTADLGYIYLAAAAEAERTLMRGFTTVRDLGGPAFALKQAIDQGSCRGRASTRRGP